ncbi:MAG: hotdog fold thioesterase [Peptococcaceae bacterium]|nr:hotdog fold thioesterase [Peptococcaceae bacterium]
MREGGNTGEIAAGRARLAEDALARHLGIKLTEVKPGYAAAVMEVTPELLNAMGVTHGGAIFSLADVAFAAACNAHGPVALALNVNIQFLKTTTVGAVLTATAREENLTVKTGLYRMEVKDENGEMVALGEGLVYRRGGGGL